VNMPVLVFYRSKESSTLACGDNSLSNRATSSLEIFYRR
jgi:hypothetical protein